MNILVLCEGDPERQHGSFSGSANSLLVELRRQGHQVQTGDVELRGLDRWLAAAGSFSLDRTRWGVKYRLGGLGFFLRSRRARAVCRRIADSSDVILQIGATFAPLGRGTTPYVLYCDSNIRMAHQGAATGVSEATSLRPGEIESVARREHEVYRTATQVFTLSERLRQVFIREFALPEDRVTACLAGPNISRAELPASIPERPPDRPPTVLFVGKAFERKGGDLLLEAFRIVRSRIPDARLMVVGPPDLDSPGPGVVSLGYLRKDVPAEWAKMREAYRSADVFCLPTRFEPFGIVFIEAMFFGLPCIGPDAWAIPEIVEHDRTGLLVPPGDVPALADAMTELLLDPEKARRMGTAGRERAEQRFTWEATVNRMVTTMRRSQTSP